MFRTGPDGIPRNREQWIRPTPDTGGNAPRRPVGLTAHPTLPPGTALQLGPGEPNGVEPISRFDSLQDEVSGCERMGVGVNKDSHLGGDVAVDVDLDDAIGP
jgi:hypothetical protein